MVDEIREVLGVVEKDGAVHALVLTGAGRAKQRPGTTESPARWAHFDRLRPLSDLVSKKRRPGDLLAMV